jgi:hypothetical protein
MTNRVSVDDQRIVVIGIKSVMDEVRFYDLKGPAAMRRIGSGPSLPFYRYPSPPKPCA